MKTCIHVLIFDTILYSGFIEIFTAVVCYMLHTRRLWAAIQHLYLENSASINITITPHSWKRNTLLIGFSATTIVSLSALNWL